MKRSILVMTNLIMVLTILCLVTLPACAQREQENNPAMPGAPGAAGMGMEDQQAQQERNALAANINALRNSELRVAILQQLLNEEAAKLLQTQAVFCDQYNLDVEKFRGGKYTFDAGSGAFVEREEE